jgi:hypothetical protein
MHATVIGARDDYTRRRSGGALHGRSHPIWMSQRDGTDCRTAPAEEGTKRTCFFGRGDDAGKKWHQFCAKWLVNEIDECAPQFFVVF